MKDRELILIRGQSYHIDEFLDENGKHDLPPPIDADALGVSERMIRNYRREAGNDYERLSYYLSNKGLKRKQANAWQSAYALWKKRQGFDF